MKTRTLFTIGLSALALTGTVGGIAIPGMTAIAASSENPKKAASAAKTARKAIAQRKAEKAVKFAEQAVGFAPNNAEYRSLLGQAYLLSGRFASAKQALEDSLTLEPGNGRVALNLALAKIAEGDWAGARLTLDAHPTSIPASDRGLAYALAGDPVKAVDILTAAVREPDATAKTRQNLALSLALAGRWPEAKSVAAIDIGPDQIDARIMEWAAFSRPANAYDQVASLLGVRPVADSGLPVQLALVQPSNVQVAAVEAAPAPAADPVDAYMPGVPANAEAVVAEVQAEQPSLDVAPVQVAATPRLVFAPRQEIVQAVPASAPRAEPARATPRQAPVVKVAAKQPAAAPAPVTLAKGKYYVQLGAYDSAAVARDSWRRAAQRIPALGKHAPQGANIRTAAGNFYRLSVGGFARADADRLCGSVRAQGGNCFVRTSTGDQLASWVKPGAQLASR